MFPAPRPIRIPENAWRGSFEEILVLIARRKYVTHHLFSGETIHLTQDCSENRVVNRPFRFGRNWQPGVGVRMGKRNRADRSPEFSASGAAMKKTPKRRQTQKVCTASSEHPVSLEQDQSTVHQIVDSRSDSGPWRISGTRAVRSMCGEIAPDAKAMISDNDDDRFVVQILFLRRSRNIPRMWSENSA